MIETQIKSALYDWLSTAMGEPAVVVIDFDADFVTGNVISGDINGDAWVPVDFDTDHDTTLAILIDQFFRIQDFVLKAVKTGPRQIIVTGAVNGLELNFTGPTVTGGASQAVATITELQTPVQIPVIFSDQNAPRPNYPYATIRLSSYRKIGWDEFRGVDRETNLGSYYGQRAMTVSVHVFAEKPAEGSPTMAFQEISKAHMSLSKDSVLNALSLAGIAIQEKGPTQNLTAVLDTLFEDHAAFDLFIGFSESIEENVGIIEKVSVQGTVNDEVSAPFTIES